MNINENENLELRNRLIEEHLPVVGRIVGQMMLRMPKYVDQSAMYSAGTMGLISACQRYEESKADVFPAYLKTKITGAILDEMRRTDSCSRRGRDNWKKMQKASDEFEQENARPPTYAELANKLGMSLDKFLHWRKIGEKLRPISIDAPAFEDKIGAATIGDLIPDENSQAIEVKFLQEDLKKALTANLSKLTEREQKIITLYYYENLSFKQIAEKFNVTVSRVSQIHQEVLVKLKNKIVRNSNKEISYQLF